MLLPLGVQGREFEAQKRGNGKHTGTLPEAQKAAGQTKTALAVFKDNTKFTEFAYQLSDSIKHLKLGGGNENQPQRKVDRRLELTLKKETAMIQNPEYKRFISSLLIKKTEIQGNLTHHLTSMRSKNNNCEVNDTQVSSKGNSFKW